VSRFFLTDTGVARPDVTNEVPETNSLGLRAAGSVLKDPLTAGGLQRVTL
jgi:hypothetical protein